MPESWRALLPTQLRWTLLAGVGLVAVAFAALNVSRERRDGLVVDLPPAASPPPAAASDRRRSFRRDSRRIRSAPEPVPVVEMPTPAPQPEASPDGSQLFLAIHHVDLSIDVLHRHVQRKPRPMPAVWLMLLDLCRTHGREERFREIALEFHRRFNVCTPAWDGFNREDPGLKPIRGWSTRSRGPGARMIAAGSRSAPLRQSRRRPPWLHAQRLQRPDRAATCSRRGARHDRAGSRRGGEGADGVRVRLREIGDPPASDVPRSSSPLVHDLEAQLEEDLTTDAAPGSAIERERPALAKMLAREWGNAECRHGCAKCSRSGDDAQPLSKEAADEVELRAQACAAAACGSGNRPANAASSLAEHCNGSAID